MLLIIKSPIVPIERIFSIFPNTIIEFLGYENEEQSIELGKRVDFDEIEVGIPVVDDNITD